MDMLYLSGKNIGAMILSPVDYLNGILNILAVVVSATVGVMIIRNYFTFKRKEFLLIGITALMMSEPWWPHAITFILLLTIREPLSIQLHFLIGYGFIPVIIICWFVAFVEFLELKRTKLILSSILIYSIIYEFFFIFFLITDPYVLGNYYGTDHFDLEYGPYMIINQIIFVGILLTNGIIFSVHSIKSDNPEISFKGKLLLLAFFSFTIGGIIDIMSPFSLIHLLVARFLLLSSAIEFYGGFFLPEWFKKRLFPE